MTFERRPYLSARSELNPIPPNAQHHACLRHFHTRLLRPLEHLETLPEVRPPIPDGRRQHLTYLCVHV